MGLFTSMTDTEFEILDELYFLKSFVELKRVLEMPEEVLKEALQKLHDKGWLKCYESAIKEPISGEPDFQANYQKYYYLATKAGLLAHNTQ